MYTPTDNNVYTVTTLSRNNMTTKTLSQLHNTKTYGITYGRMSVKQPKTKKPPDNAILAHYAKYAHHRNMQDVAPCQVEYNGKRGLSLHIIIYPSLSTQQDSVAVDCG